MADETPDPTTQPDAEPSDEQLRSDEARRYRLQRNEARDTAADIARQMTGIAAQRDAAQRQAVNAELRGHFANPDDFWTKTELNTLRGEDGPVDISLVQGQRDQILGDYPHYQAAQITTAPADVVNSSGMIGQGPRNLLDTDNTQPAEVRGWAGFLQDAARGEG